MPYSVCDCASPLWGRPLGKPLFEMCWFCRVFFNHPVYGHCPDSFRPSPFCQTGKHEKSAPNHPCKPLHPRENVKKCLQPYWQAFTPPPPYRQCPYGNNTSQKVASLRHLWMLFFQETACYLLRISIMYCIIIGCYYSRNGSRLYWVELYSKLKK